MNRWGRKAVFLLSALLTAAGICEFTLRHACGLRAIDDIRRSHYVWAVNQPLYYGSSGLWVIKPRHHSSFAGCGRRVEFDTAPCPNPAFGYRINGTAPYDSGPVFGVVLGDSVTEARHVDNSAGYVARLSALAGKRFINAGRPKSCPAEDILYLKQSGLLALRPKVVVFQLYPFDRQTSVQFLVRREYARRGKTLPFQSLADSGSAPPLLIRAAKSSLAFFHLYHSFIIGLAQTPFIDERINAETARRLANKQMRDAIDQLAALGKLRGFKTMVLVDGVARLPEVYAYAAKRTIAVDIGFVDDDKRFRFDGHPNEAGHETIARAVFERMRKLRWLSGLQ